MKRCPYFIAAGFFGVIGAVAGYVPAYVILSLIWWLFYLAGEKSPDARAFQLGDNTVAISLLAIPTVLAVVGGLLGLRYSRKWMIRDVSNEESMPHPLD